VRNKVCYSHKTFDIGVLYSYWKKSSNQNNGYIVCKVLIGCFSSASTKQITLRRFSWVSFCRSLKNWWFYFEITKYSTYLRKGTDTLPEHFSWPLVFSEVRFAQSLVFCVVFCISLFILLSFLFEFYIHVVRFKHTLYIQMCFFIILNAWDTLKVDFPP
jgi:hypothetical protein